MTKAPGEEDGEAMYLTLGPSSSCEHTLFCLNQDGNSVTERSRVASDMAANPPLGLRPELALSALSIFNRGGGLLSSMPARMQGTCHLSQQPSYWHASMSTSFVETEESYFSCQGCQLARA